MRDIISLEQSKLSKVDAVRLRLAGRARVGLLVGLVATVVVAIAGVLTWPNYLELRVLDLRQRLFPVAESHPDIAVLAIDDKSLEQIGPWPWPRRYLADLVAICHEAGARQVSLDILLPEEQKPEITQDGVTDLSMYEPPPNFVGTPEPIEIDNDQRLADAMVQAGKVIVPFYARLLADENDQEAPSGASVAQRGREVMRLLELEGTLSFEQVLERVCPDRRDDVRDEDYHQTLLSYIWARGMKAVAGFSLKRRPDQIAIPLYSMAEITPPVPRFAEAMSDTGFVSVLADYDGIVRRVPLLSRSAHESDATTTTLYKQLVFTSLCDMLDITDDDIDLTQPGRIVLRGTDIEIPLDEDGQMIVSWTRHWWQDPCTIPVTQVFILAQVEQAVKDNQAQLNLVNDLVFALSTVPDDLSELDAETVAAVEEMRQKLALLGDPCELAAVNRDLNAELVRHRALLLRKFEGKIVLVGSVATGEAGARDFVATPSSKLTPGVMVHRNTLNTILQGAFVYRPPRVLEIAAVILLGALMTVVAAHSRPLVSGIVLGVLVVVTVGANLLLFGYSHYWFALVSLVGAVAGSFTAVTFYRQITEGRDRRRITARFKQYVSPTVVDRIVSSGKGFTFAGEKRELTCYFSDLAGFTTVSERLGPEKTVKVLNIYLDRMTEVLDRYDATINKFEGDGVFAFFGAPVDLPGHAQLACQAALAGQQALTDLVRQQQQENPEWPGLSMRIGLNTGDAVVGDCGSHRRFDYTAIGDTVNLAARLESANKYFGSKLMISETTRRQVEDIDVRYLGKVRVVGKEIGVGIYELLGPAGAADADQCAYNEMFAAAVEDYQQARFEQAVTAFESCLQRRGDDKAASLYRDTSREYVQVGTRDDFSGCIELTGK